MNLPSLDIGKSLALCVLLDFEAETFRNCGLPRLEDLDATLLLVKRLEFGEHGTFSCSKLLLVDLLESSIVKVKLLPHLLQVKVEQRSWVLRLLLCRVELPRCGLLQRRGLHQRGRASRHRVVGLESHVFLPGVNLRALREGRLDLGKGASSLSEVIVALRDDVVAHVWMTVLILISGCRVDSNCLVVERGFQPCRYRSD